MATGDEVGKGRRREEEDRSENILEGEREEGRGSVQLRWMAPTEREGGEGEQERQKRPGEKGKGGKGHLFPASVGKGDIFLYSPPSLHPSLALTVVIFGSSFFVGLHLTRNIAGGGWL